MVNDISKELSKEDIKSVFEDIPNDFTVELLDDEEESVNLELLLKKGYWCAVVMMVTVVLVRMSVMDTKTSGNPSVCVKTRDEPRTMHFTFSSGGFGVIGHT